MSLNTPSRPPFPPLFATLRAEPPLDTLKALSELLEQGADINELCAQGEGVLHEAVRQHRMGVAELLIQHGADVNLPNRAGYTALHIAALCHSFEFVSFLLDQGSDPSLLNSTEDTALDLAKSRYADPESPLIALLEAATLALHEKTVLRDALSQTLTQTPAADASTPEPGARAASKRLVL